MAIYCGKWGTVEVSVSFHFIRQGEQVHIDPCPCVTPDYRIKDFLRLTSHILFDKKKCTVYVLFGKFRQEVKIMSTGAGTGCPAGRHNPVQAIQDLMIEESLAKIRHKILVMSGKGGVGKSTISTNIALVLSQRGCQVGLLDIDLHGPDIALLLGMRDQSPGENQGTADAVRYSDTLKFMSIEYLMADKDQAIIWRGPLKYKAIKTFLADVRWGELDYLIIDSPPGTGDEPLTIAQTIKDARALIVTTPQEVSLSDVRKSIRFCGKAEMSILGLIENMSGLVCPHCQKEIPLFKKGGGGSLAREMQVPFLGSIPLDPEVVHASDEGKPFMLGTRPGSEAATAAFNKIVDQITAKDSTACSTNS
ncbi:MAG: Mrp/NBP35 family ATP-binding protein [Pseudomonadota bacterium]